MPLRVMMADLGMLFQSNTSSLCQAVVADELPGRVISIMGCCPGQRERVFLGGLANRMDGEVVLVYGGIGVLKITIPRCFAFTGLAHAER
jgi:hypothetical protein